MATELYNEMRKMGDLYRECMDCAVIALAIATLTPYNEVHALLASVGRKHRRRTPLKYSEKVFEKITGKKHTAESTRLWFGKRIPVSKIAEYLPKGTYLCYTRGHTFALVDGVVHDWTNGRRHLVIEFVKVE